MCLSLVCLSVLVICIACILIEAPFSPCRAYWHLLVLLVGFCRLRVAATRKWSYSYTESVGTLRHSRSSRLTFRKRRVATVPLTRGIIKGDTRKLSRRWSGVNLFGRTQLSLSGREQIGLSSCDPRGVGPTLLYRFDSTCGKST